MTVQQLYIRNHQCSAFNAVWPPNGSLDWPTTWIPANYHARFECVSIERQPASTQTTTTIITTDQQQSRDIDSLTDGRTGQPDTISCNHRADSVHQCNDNPPPPQYDHYHCVTGTITRECDNARRYLPNCGLLQPARHHHHPNVTANHDSNKSFHNSL